MSPLFRECRTVSTGALAVRRSESTRRDVVSRRVSWSQRYATLRRRARRRLPRRSSLMSIASVCIATMQATAIRAARSEYSIRSWPSSSRTKRFTRFFMSLSPVTFDVTGQPPAGSGVGLECSRLCGCASRTSSPVFGDWPVSSLVSLAQSVAVPFAVPPNRLLMPPAVAGSNPIKLLKSFAAERSPIASRVELPGSVAA